MHFLCLERYETGILRYNFKNGESAKSFIERLSDFVEMIRKDNFKHDVIVIITHGFEMRIIMMHMFGWSEDYFESLEHPDRCEFKKIILTKDHTFRLESKMRTFDPLTNTKYILRKKKS